MVLIYCSRCDAEALWLFGQLETMNDLDVEIFYVEELYECKNWELRVNDCDSFASVTLPNGRTVSNRDVSFFLNRVMYVSHPFWKKMDKTECDYFHQEWNAFMLGWLQCFESVLINRPLPGYLAGYSPAQLTWQIIARRSGFNIKPQYFSSDLNDLPRLKNGAIPPNITRILVFNHKVFANKFQAELARACIELSKVANCGLMEVCVNEDGGKYYFISASVVPAFSLHSVSFIRALRGFVFNTIEKEIEESVLLIK